MSYVDNRICVRDVLNISPQFTPLIHKFVCISAESCGYIIWINQLSRGLCKKFVLEMWITLAVQTMGFEKHSACKKGADSQSAPRFVSVSMYVLVSFQYVHVFKLELEKMFHFHTFGFCKGLYGFFCASLCG